MLDETVRNMREARGGNAGDAATTTTPPRRTTSLNAARRHSPRLVREQAAVVMVRQVNRNSTITNMFHRLPPRGRDSGTAPAAAPAATAAAGGAAVGRRTGETIEFAGIERERAKKRKAPEGPRGRAKATRITQQTHVPVSQRLVEFPDQGFKESAGKLLCVPCKEALQNLKEGLKRHIRSQKHRNSLAQMRSRKASDIVLCKHLSDYFEEHNHEKGVRCTTPLHSVYAHACLHLLNSRRLPPKFMHGATA